MADGDPEARFADQGGRRLSGCAEHCDDCHKCHKIVCVLCGLTVMPRIGGYWFLLLSPRGRVRFPGVEELRVVLCSGCGRRLRDRLAAEGYDVALISQACTGPPS